MFVKLRGEFGAIRPAATPAALIAALLAGLVFCAPARGGEVDQGSAVTPADQPPAAGQDDSAVKKALKFLNIASDPGEPKDFVRAARPANPDSDAYVPVFRPTTEHKSKLLTPDQLKALEGELGGVETRGAQIRDAFPPARRAYLESEKEKAEKAEAKKKKSASPNATQ
jgi:hypothetical protein